MHTAAVMAMMAAWLHVLAITGYTLSYFTSHLSQEISAVNYTGCTVGSCMMWADVLRGVQ